MGEKRKPATICIQSGWKPKNGEPRVLPIYQSTTFKYETSEQMGRLFDLEEDGYFYTRLANPTNDAVAEKICELEGGVAAMLTSSGQAANYYAAFNICNAGDHIISAATIYGGTYNLFGVTLPKLGIEVTFVDQDASEEEIARMTEGTPAEWFEESARRCHEIYDWVRPGDELGQEFYNAHAPFAEYQLVLSGYRLAKVLNALFDR